MTKKLVQVSLIVVVLQIHFRLGGDFQHFLSHVNPSLLYCIYVRMYVHMYIRTYISMSLHCYHIHTVNSTVITHTHCTLYCYHTYVHTVHYCYHTYTLYTLLLSHIHTVHSTVITHTHCTLHCYHTYTLYAPLLHSYVHTYVLCR